MSALTRRILSNDQDVDTSELGEAVLTSGTVEPPLDGAPLHDVLHPIAFDADEVLGAVSFAIWDPYPGDFEPEWWCVAELFMRRDGEWASCWGQHDNSTSPTPFQRPAADGEWVHWHSNGPAPVWEEEPRERFSFFGIAPEGTERLTVRGEDGRERDLRITPWCGAYVGVVAGGTATLTGYDAAGNRLGAYDLGGHAEPPDPGPEPGYRRVLPPPIDEPGGEPILEIPVDAPLPPGWREVE
jgi:hypothetical protein